MQSVWETDNADFRKRKRVAKACDACQRKKKRCTHVFHHLNTAEESIDLNSNDESTTVDAPRERRFISDLVPESHLVTEKGSPGTGERLSHIGVFLEEQSVRRNSSPESASNTLANVKDRVQPLPPPPKPGHAYLKKYLEAAGALRILPKETQRALVEIYFKQIHPFLLIIDESEFRPSFSANSAPRLLVNAICIAACKAEDATIWLRLAEGGSLLSTKEFASALYHGLTAAIHAGLETHRLTKARILALMSLHCEGVGGIEEASMHLTYALHCATTDALQLDYAGRKKFDDSLSACFWSLWTMDRINVCIAGRPLAIVEHDIGIGRFDKPIDSKRRVFDIWYDLSSLVEKTVSFYRPGTTPDVSGWEEGYPSFEAVIGENLEDGIAESSFASLELYYQAVTVIACRADSPATASYARQALAALRIQSLLTIEHATDVAPLPIVPYAASLALSVAYRHLRRAEIPSRVRTALSNLRICIDILERLARTWWSAVAMANLGKKILDRYSKNGRPKGVMGTTKPREVRSTQPAVSSTTQIPSNSLDILSTAAEAHGRGKNDNVASRSETETTLQADVEGMATLSAPVDGIPSLPDNWFEDFDALFGDYLDVSLPTNYLDTGLFSPEDTLSTYAPVPADGLRSPSSPSNPHIDYP